VPVWSRNCCLALAALRSSGESRRNTCPRATVVTSPEAARAGAMTRSARAAPAPDVRSRGSRRERSASLAVSSDLRRGQPFVLAIVPLGPIGINERIRPHTHAAGTPSGTPGSAGDRLQSMRSPGRDGRFYLGRSDMDASFWRRQFGKPPSAATACGAEAIRSSLSECAVTSPAPSSRLRKQLAAGRVLAHGLSADS
jgi:hypothetical protein